MTEQFARDVNGIDLCYETFGEPWREPLLLIMGLGAPLTWWDAAFCELLADRGFYVVRFDNRDVGRSTWLDGRADLRLALLLRRSPYALDDLAADAAGLLDHLGLAQAHVVGTSMGGMIAQLLAIRYPQRVRSLTSIMSTTGHKFVGRPSLTGWQALLSGAPADRESYLDHQVRTSTRLRSPGYPIEEERVRARAAMSFDRGLNAAGRARHLAAILATADRTPKLRELRLPVTVIHGTDDHLVNVSGGLATARAVPGAELHVINGLGHELPPALWSRFADFIEHTAQRPAAVAA
ncbi:MAG: alpha/beta fold hydrolase [Thermocrispum sp.]